MDERALQPIGRDPLMSWLIFTGVSVFAFILLWYFGMAQQMLAGDRTYISSIIVAFYLCNSAHCLWRILAVVREGDAARRVGSPDHRQAGRSTPVAGPGRAQREEWAQQAFADHGGQAVEFGAG